ncbi:MAG: hypothetical protein K0R54_266 [Clostridiaceae bacterium]|jgi:hypothetical protein|nr:hypothetical protein [Clostridiaceae bacterium]
MKKVISIILVTITLFSLAGCVSISSIPIEDKSSYETSAKANEESAKAIITNDTLPKITKSLERENIKKRVEFINQSDRIGYLYLLSKSGQLIKEVQVLGKVSNLNSYLTPMEDIHIVDTSTNFRTAESPVITQAPDLDGTYGLNADGIFWFTPEGVYQEWSGQYFYSADRMSFTTQPLLMEIQKTE